MVCFRPGVQMVLRGAILAQNLNCTLRLPWPVWASLWLNSILTLLWGPTGRAPLCRSREPPLKGSNAHASDPRRAPPGSSQSWHRRAQRPSWHRGGCSRKSCRQTEGDPTTSFHRLGVGSFHFGLEAPWGSVWSSVKWE